MQCNPPSFWRRKPALVASLLQPFAMLYGIISRKRMQRITPVAVRCPVICIGNITAGGAGKTPVAIAIQQLLQREGIHAFFLSRGYGGTCQGTHLVDIKIDTAEYVGDEPLLLAQYAPVIVSRNRIQGAEAAIAAGAGIIIMDDGFQNPSLAKDLSLLVIDGNYGLGNGCLLPAGPLRETLKNALKRVQAVVIIGEDKYGVSGHIPATIPIVFATLQPKKSIDFQGRPHIAFAGIGNPQKFFTTLSGSGCILTATHAFPDHYSYTAEDIKRLRIQAKDAEAVLITTEKDWVRLPEALRENIAYFPVEIAWEDEEKVREVLKKVE